MKNGAGCFFLETTVRSLGLGEMTTAMICDYRPPLALDQAETLHAQMHPARSECLARRAVIAACLGTAEDHGSICVEGLEVQPGGHLIEWRLRGALLTSRVSIAMPRRSLALL
jgi:hypothetical protein